MTKESEPKPYVSKWKPIYDNFCEIIDSAKRGESDLADVFSAVETIDKEHKDIFEDVYHLALHMEVEYINNIRKGGLERENSMVYRGQQDENWTITPSIFRPKYPVVDLPEEELRERYDRTIALVSDLKQEYPEFSELQCLAIAQHYSYEAQVPTWLVDFTYNPLVALNFASQKGRDGQIGTLTGLSTWNWEPYGATGDGGVNIVSIVRKIDVPGVPRIERQQALFVDNVHPEILDQGLGYIYKWKFHQHEGLVFEDHYEGICEDDLLYPEEDDYLKFIKSWKYEKSDKPDLLSLPKNPHEILIPEDYILILKGWFDHSFRDKYTDEDDSEIEELIFQLAHLHNDIYQLKKSGIPQIEIRLDMLGNAMWDYFLTRKDDDKKYGDILKIRYIYYPDYNVESNMNLKYFEDDFLKEIEECEDREERLEINQRISDIIDYYFPESSLL